MRSEHKSRRAIAALERTHFLKSRRNRIVIVEPLGGRDSCAGCGRCEHEAARDGLAADQHGACAANADPASEPDRPESRTPEGREQRVIAASIELDRLLIESNVDPHESSTDSAVIGRLRTECPAAATALPIAAGTPATAISPSPWLCSPPCRSS